MTHIILKRHCFSIFFCAIAALSIISCARTESQYFESMNTFMKVQCYGKHSAEAVSAAQKRITELETLLSVTKPESDIYRLNNAPSYPVSVSEETAHLISFSLDIAEKTGGAFNPCLYPVTSLWGFTQKNFRVPSAQEIASALPLTDFRRVKVSGTSLSAEKGMMLDMGAVGKGFAGDEAIKIMRKQGIRSALLDLGGNIQTIGGKPDGSPWSIGIKNPFGAEPLGTVSARDEAVITSGGYERYFTGDDGRRYIHIFDGRTGFPVANEVVSATAVAGSGVLCDALSTSLFVMGAEKAAGFWRENPGFEFIIVIADKKLFLSGGLEARFTLNPDCADIEISIVRRNG